MIMSGAIDIVTVLQTKSPVGPQGPTGPTGVVTPELQASADAAQAAAQQAQTYANLLLMAL